MADPVSQTTTETPSAVSTQPVAPASPQTSQPSPASTPPATVGAPTTPSGPPSSGAVSAPPGSPAAPGTPAPAQPAWLSSLRESGVDFGTADEKEVLQRVAQMHRDLQTIRPLAPYVDQFRQHAPAFQQYLQSLNKPAAAVPEAEKPWHAKFWNPPEYNTGWMSQVKQNEDGSLVPLPGASPDIPGKILAYQNFRREQAEKFMSNPATFIEPIVRHLAREQAQELIQQQMRRRDDTQSSQAFVQENQSWLYEIDPATKMVKQQQQFDPSTGQYTFKPQLSQWGQAFGHYVQQEAQRQGSRGYQDIEEQKRNAIAFVQRDYAIAQLRAHQSSAAPANPGAPQLTPQQIVNQQFLQGNNPPAGIPATGGPTAPAPELPPSREKLADFLRKNFVASGITDQHINGNL